MGLTDREEVWDNFGQADKHMVYGHASDYLEVTLEHKGNALFTGFIKLA